MSVAMLALVLLFPIALLGLLLLTSTLEGKFVGPRQELGVVAIETDGAEQAAPAARTISR